MDATLEFVRARPAAGPLLLVGTRRPLARDAPDRAVTRVVEGVVRNVVRHDVRPDVFLAPVGQRLDLPDAVPVGALDLPRARPRGRLVAADAGDPCIVRVERPDQRLDLPDVAAAVGIRLPEVRPLLPVLLGDRDDVGLDREEAVALDETVTRLVGLLEE